MKYSEKTIPYRLSQAELENLQILRRRTQSFRSMQDVEDEKGSSEETNARNSDPDQLKKKTAGKSS